MNALSLVADDLRLSHELDDTELARAHRAKLARRLALCTPLICISDENEQARAMLTQAIAVLDRRHTPSTSHQIVKSSYFWNFT